jgi:hypothetical protein
MAGKQKKRSQREQPAASRDAEEARAREGGAVPPSEHVVDPANTGPGTAHPEADPVAGFSPERAVSDREARDQAGKDQT